MKAGVIRSRRNQAARNRIISGSKAHSSTYRLAVIVVSPIRPSAYARPGLRRPSRPSSGEPSVRNEIPWWRISDGKDGEARRELDRQQRERRDLVEGSLADDRPDTPAGGGQDQCSEVTRGDRRTRHGGAPSRGDDGNAGAAARWFLVVAARIAGHSPATRSSSLHPRHRYSKVRCIATALVEQAVSNSTERATSAGTFERSMTS